MDWLYEATRYSHVVAGVAALVLFWVPALSRKGGVVHRRAGRLYVWFMSIVVATAVPLSVVFFVRGNWEVGTFLGYLSVITFSALWGGRRVLDVKASPEAFRTPFHAGVGILNLVSSLAVLAIAWTVAPAGFMRILFTVFSIIGLSAAMETLQFFRRPPTDRRWWWYQHMGGMIGSGIAAHTAFGVFGMRRLFPELELGSWGLLPWVAPSVVGTIATVMLTRHYRRRFGPARATAQAPATPGSA
jgi:uncharacterized membrane protein